MAGAVSRVRDWWSHTLFPGDATATHAPDPCRKVVRLCEALLVLAAALLSFSRLDCPLQEPEETLYAEVPRQMLAADRVLVPVRHGQAYYDKPPLLYWLVMAAYRVFGIHDWTARLIPSSAAFFCVLVTYAWGKRTAGPRAAFAGAMMLCLSPRFAQMAHMLTTNGLLTLCVISAVAAAHAALSGLQLRRRWWLLSAVACGFGVLTKGPVAAVLVLAPVAGFAMLDRRCPRIGWRQWLVYALAAGTIAVPWFVIVALRDPAFLDYFVCTHHIRRFVDPIDHPQPFWYYGPVLLLGMLPWTLLVPGLVTHLMARAPAVRAERTAAPGFFLLAGLSCLMFFSASGCKRPSYILPAMPPLALALGCYVGAACRLGRIRIVHWAGTATAAFLALAVLAQWWPEGYAARFSLRDQLRPHVFDADGERAAVMCYPHGWDAVPFYLQRGDVRVFKAAQLADMISALKRAPRSLVVVKADDSLDDFERALPASLEFVCSSREPTVAVGWVRHR